MGTPETSLRLENPVARRKTSRKPWSRRKTSLRVENLGTQENLAASKTPGHPENPPVSKTPRHAGKPRSASKTLGTPENVTARRKPLGTREKPLGTQENLAPRRKQPENLASASKTTWHAGKTSLRVENPGIRAVYALQLRSPATVSLG
jgi:hypothetical protein